jgi:hypothetical protein
METRSEQNNDDDDDERSIDSTPPIKLHTARIMTIK